MVGFHAPAVEVPVWHLLSECEMDSLELLSAWVCFLGVDDDPVCLDWTLLPAGVRGHPIVLDSDVLEGLKVSLGVGVHVTHAGSANILVFTVFHGSLDLGVAPGVEQLSASVCESEVAGLLHLVLLGGTLTGESHWESSILLDLVPLSIKLV